MVDILARVSVGNSTQKERGEKWRTWCNARAVAQGKSPGLLKPVGTDATVVA